MTNNSWALLLSFDTNDPEFVRGFEAGRIWERIKADQTDWDMLIHNGNAEMVMRMCEVQSRTYRAEIFTDDYIRVFIS